MFENKNTPTPAHEHAQARAHARTQTHTQARTHTCTYRAEFCHDECSVQPALVFVTLLKRQAIGDIAKSALSAWRWPAAVGA